MTSLPLARFRHGRIITTPGALAALSPDDITVAIRRHSAGDWGDVSNADCKRNEAALNSGHRLVSAYRSALGALFWVITEADRQTTTILLFGES